MKAIHTRYTTYCYQQKFRWQSIFGSQFREAKYPASKGSALDVGSVYFPRAGRYGWAHTAALDRVRLARSSVPRASRPIRKTWLARCMKKKRSRMTGSGSLHLRISLSAAQGGQWLHGTEHAVDSMCDNVQLLHITIEGQWAYSKLQ